MTELTDLLDRFNRKERNLLIRDILGHSPEQGLSLSADFRKRMHTALINVKVSPDAWWATDYHLDWLAGALTLYEGGVEDLEQARNAGDHAGLVKGKQEDVDLLIADGQNLFLIEAKAYGAWSNTQADSKIARFATLIRYYESIKTRNQPLKLHMVQMSPRPPMHLHDLPKDWPGDHKQLHYVALKIPSTLSIYEVSRCDEEKTIGKDGGWWRIVEKPAAKATNTK